MYRVLLDNVSENREKFVELHTKPGYYGSSSIANVAGLNPHCSPLQEWVYQKELRVREDLSHNIRVRRGIAMEPVLAELFTEHTGKPVEPFNQVIQHETYDWAIASPDYRCLKEYALVECKCVSYRTKHYWEGGGAPDYYLIQLQWQMGISGIHYGYFSALVGEDDVYTPAFSFSQDIYEQLLEQAIKFRELVQGDIPPEAGPGDAKAIKAIYEKREEEIEIFNQQLVDEYFLLKSQVDEAKKPLKELEEQLDTTKNNIMLSLGGATRGRCGNRRFKVTTTNFTMPARECERTTFKAWEEDETD